MPADNTRRITRIVGYVRVSTKMQGASGLGLAAQRSAIEAYAERIGAKVMQVFEEVESGRNTDRPQLAEAVKKCQLTGAALVAARLDRFGRKASHLLTLREARFPVIPLDVPDADGFMFTILAAVAEKEAESIAVRTRAALAAKKAKGKKVGGDPAKLIQYAVEGRAKSAVVRGAAAQERATMLAPIISDLKKVGAGTLQEIADGLNEQGIQAPRGGEWSSIQVARVMARING